MTKRQKSNKKFSIYSTTLIYDRIANESHTEYKLEAETDEVADVGKLCYEAQARVIKEIQDYAPTFRSYYTRIAYFTTEDCKDDLYLWMDFGSHCQFIELHFKDQAALDEYTAYQQSRKQ